MRMRLQSNLGSLLLLVQREMAEPNPSYVIPVPAVADLHPPHPHDGEDFKNEPKPFKKDGEFVAKYINECISGSKHSNAS